MQNKIMYKSCSTGLITEYATTLADPTLVTKWTGGKYGLQQMEEVFLKQSNATYPFSQMAQGLYRNMMQGGPLIPHGALDGKEGYVWSAISATDENFTPVAHRDAGGNYIWETDKYYIITDRRVPPEDRMKWEDAPYNGEIIQLGTYTADTNPIDLNGADQFANAHPMWSPIQKISVMPASYDLTTGEFGVVYQLEQPTQMSTCTGVDGGTQTIEVTFTKSSDAAITAYAVAVLKLGDYYSRWAAPVAIPEFVTPSDYGSDKVALWTGDGTAVASGGTNLTDNTTTFTTPGIDTYFKATTPAAPTTAPTVTNKQAIAAGSYYAIVWGLTNTWFDSSNNILYMSEDSRISDPKISAVITVA